MGNHEEEVASNLERADTNLQVARELLDKEYDDVSAKGLCMINFPILDFFIKSI